ncbi:MAG: ABC transporter ATP-binding protein/permease [Desulfovibrio sp.]|nr:ABC transporter ATP-binding protein/permease [Desulfovibrio sp.]
MTNDSASTWKMFWSIFRGYWISEKKWEAWGLMAIAVALTVAQAWLLVLFNRWQKPFFDMFDHKDFSMFWSYTLEFVLIAFSFILAAAYGVFVQRTLRIRWRIWLTRKYLRQWMGNQAYYRLQVLGSDADNPDQRISEDVGDFVKLTLELMLGFLRKMTILVAFYSILWNLSGVLTFQVGKAVFALHGYMFWVSLLYAVVGTYCAHAVGGKLIPLNFSQQKYEADFRFSMMRVRENSESIAFYGGESMEMEGFRTYFRNCVRNYLQLIRRHKLLSLYTNTYGQTAFVIPILMAAPRLFSGGFLIGDFMQLQNAFLRVQDALSFFVDSYATLASLASVIRRLGLFTRHMEETHAVNNGVQKVEGKAGRFRTAGLHVQLPDGRSLLRNCSLDLERGQRLLVTGPSGCGKSTFLRTISGIWPFGSGEVETCGEESCLFLPQRPYLPLGTLRRAVCYPLPNAPDDRLSEALRLVQMQGVIPRLDERDDWSRILSLGEQLRIAFARVLLVRPRWIFLDEATSALDEQREKDMYELLRRELPDAAIVSVGHRSTLFPLHDTELHICAGDWLLRPIVTASGAGR